MSEIWKRWEGQVIDHKYQLRHFLGSTDHSAVFCAEYRDPEIRKAAVKFLAADLPNAEQVLADWMRAQQLSHPNLLEIYSVGRCRIEDMDLLYAAMEYAEENLSEILPHRALTPTEAQEMLSVVADVLVYLHGKKMIHGHVKPSNIVAIGDQLKLTSDTIRPHSEVLEMRRKRDVYDAPEIPASPYTPAADVWSLGVTLVETLTQQPAFLPFNENAEPVIAPTVRDPFRDVASHALRRDPDARWSSAEVAMRLNPEAAESVKAALAAAAAANSSAASRASRVAASASEPVASVAVAESTVARASSTSPPAAAPAVSPLSVPLSKEPAVPLAKQSTSKAPPLRPPMPPTPVARPATKPAAPREPVELPNYVLPLFAAVVVLIAVIALPKILRRGTASSANTSTSATNPVPSSAGNSANAPISSTRPVNPAATPSGKVDSTLKSTAAPTRSTPVPAPPAPARLNTEPARTVSPKRASSNPDRGEVLDQILPRPSSAALSTIQGTLRVVVRVQVDAAGNVTQATLDNATSSRYFADQSLQAARGWVFLSPAPEGHSVPSEWLIRFEFTPAGSNAFPSQVKP
jgi:TonB family protein